MSCHTPAHHQPAPQQHQQAVAIPHTTPAPGSQQPAADAQTAAQLQDQPPVSSQQQQPVGSGTDSTAVAGPSQQAAAEAVGGGRDTTPVAEMLRTERWMDAEFQAAQAAEMELRDAVIKQQQGEAQRMKKHRREAHLRTEAVAKQQQVIFCTKTIVTP